MRRDLDALVAATIRACDARHLTKHALATHAQLIPSKTPITVVAAGKAATPMLRAFEETFGARIRACAVAAPDTGCGHPEPNDASVEAGRRALAIAGEAGRSGEPLVVLLSGGASALLAVPADGLTLADKIAATRVLLRSGLPIATMNAVRRHLSAIKGGRLAAAARRTITFAISDVHAPIEDDPAAIGSGPTVADPSTFGDVLHALRARGVFDDMPPAVREHVMRGAAGEREETIKPGDPRLHSSDYLLVGSRRDAMDGVAAEASARGYHVTRIEAPTLGEAREAARAFMTDVRARLTSAPQRLCVVASGETTVRIEGRAGKGGRNQEFALAAALEEIGSDAWALASVGTDGIDGPTDAAGAIVDASTTDRARAGALDAASSLGAHNAYPFFHALGDLIVTGPTGTNVGDVQIFVSRHAEGAR